VRVKEGDRGESKFHIVQAIARIENSRPLVWRFLGYHQTRIRILAPREREDLSHVLNSAGLREVDDLFSLFNIQDYSRRKDIFDIRGDVFFDRDRFFFQSRGVNSFEHSVHIGVTSTTGLYRIFFTVSAWLDWRQKPTAAETLFVKRNFVDDARPEQLGNFMSALQSLREGNRQTYAHVLNPIFLPEVKEADKTLRMLRGTLSSNQD